jgi:GxxExxY protein
MPLISLKRLPSHWWIIFDLTAKDTKVSQWKAMGKFESFNENLLSREVLNIAYEVHTKLGPGLLENAYKQVLFFKLNQAGFQVEIEKPMPLIIDDIKLDLGYKIDLLVENKLVLELKSVESLTDIHTAQILNYLKLGKFKLGLLINFNEIRLKYGIKRVVNGLED